MASWRENGRVLAVVALGGVVGACARYGAGLLWPAPPGAFPWTTLVVNATGCAALGVVMVLWSERPLLRPFAGTGVLGGFTTFSAYTADVHRLVAGGGWRSGWRTWG
ncbi:CrcB family protein [Actinokineospora soli]|uniref:Fluoride-specific ion channel FluC n=1 Tax=Actinokineospora soli TaxID=1048753 RepID=A0ABW2TWC1_9PSEU